MAFPGTGCLWHGGARQVCFFGCLFFLGIDGEFATVEVAGTLIKDAGVGLSPLVTALLLCGIGFVCGVPLVTDVGFYWFDIFAGMPAGHMHLYLT